VLCAWTVLPDRPAPAGGPAVEPGLGLVPDLLVLPHWDGPEGRQSWLRAVDRAVPPGVQVVGLPEQAGVLVEDGALTAVGSAASAVLSDRGDLPVGSTRRLA
jgi:hypothetical protein